MFPDSLFMDARKGPGILRVFSLFLLLFFVSSNKQYVKNSTPGETGILVVSPDPGLMRNQEIGTLFNTFKVDQPAVRAFMGSGHKVSGQTVSAMGTEGHTQAP